MEIPIYQIDAFTDKVFKGNPAAVCILHDWIEDKILQNIAGENNLSETAFVVPRNNIYEIRWFTPQTEINLCGHATLAAGFLILNLIKKEKNLVRFISLKSGELLVIKKDDLLEMNFPVSYPVKCKILPIISEALKKRPVEILKAEDYLAVYDTEKEITDLSPDFELLKKIDLRGVIVTAAGKKSDFVSRFFAPKVGINEDPVTGSSHCTLVPYWSKKLNKTDLYAIQVSGRGGELYCKHIGNRVIILGNAICYMKGSITI